MLLPVYLRSQPDSTPTLYQDGKNGGIDNNLLPGSLDQYASGSVNIRAARDQTDIGGQQNRKNDIDTGISIGISRGRKDRHQIEHYGWQKRSKSQEHKL